MIELIIAGAVLLLGGLGYWKLKKIRKVEFESYLKSEQYRLDMLKVNGWMVDGVDVLTEIDYTKSWNNFKKTKFWNYDFHSIVVITKRKIDET